MSAARARLGKIVLPMIVILLVIFVSVLPGIIAFGREWLKARRTART